MKVRQVKVRQHYITPRPVKWRPHFFFRDLLSVNAWQASHKRNSMHAHSRNKGDM